MMTPEAIEVAADPNRQLGAVLDRFSAGLMFGGLSLAQCALVVVSGNLKAATGTEPDWDFGEDNDATTRVQVNEALAAEVTVKETSIEPWFDGRSVPGVSIIIALRKAER